MTTSLDRPPSSAADATSTHTPVRHPPRRRGWLERYQQHLWLAGLSLVVIALAAGPSIIGSLNRTSIGGPAAAARATAVSPANLSTHLSITASEFRFNPSSIQVPMGQKVSLTLENAGAVQHDITIPSIGFSLVAKPAQTASGEVTFDKAGILEFICSIPGHKEAGMKGTLTVVDAQAGAPPVTTPRELPQTAAASVPEIKPLPEGLKPLAAPHVAPPIDRTEPDYVKIDLTTTRVTAQLADGVAYEFWTFNDTVPGPMLRVREGDTVEISLSNAADAGVTHSIDLHAVTGPGGGAKVMQIAPGEKGSFRFRALNPGVYVYHCATPMVAHHIANGMYGLIVVEPKGGLPRVDHEYYLMQGDFYLQGQRGDQGLRAFDLNKMLEERPDYVLFNGAVGALTGANALTARVGESIRIFFGVGGPNVTSSFHVIGIVFDRVYPEAALAQPSTNVQTTHVPTGGATVVEFTARVPGTYTIVDHSLGRLEKGAAGQIVIEGPDDPEIFQPLSPSSR